MRRWLKPAAILLAALVLVASVAFWAWTRLARYPAFPEAIELAEQARSERGWYVFEPAEESGSGLILYPGGLVDPAAYAPLMAQLAEGGVLAVVVPMPLDLAVFGVGRADDVISAYPDVDVWVIGGHSLGGAMAAEYLKRGPDAVGGLVFLASYPAESTDLSDTRAKVLSLYGTEDDVAGDAPQRSAARLPEDARLEAVAGGNHAQFGHYGPQKGDGTATISREEQQRQTASAILDLLESLE